MNRGSHDDLSPPQKKQKLDALKKHSYPAIPSSADDETSIKTNLGLLNWNGQLPNLEVQIKLKPY